MSMPLLIADHVRKTYLAGDTTVEAVRDISLSVDAGDFVALVGPSGCGKSTLLHLCGGMDRPSAGSVTLEGARLEALDDDRLTRVRRERVGFVFQFFNLLPTLTLGENIALPLLLAGMAPRESAAPRACARRTRGRRAPAVALSRSSCPEASCSGPPSRARSCTGPALLVADEPTGQSRLGQRRPRARSARGPQRARWPDDSPRHPLARSRGRRAAASSTCGTVTSLRVEDRRPPAGTHPCRSLGSSSSAACARRSSDRR